MTIETETQRVLKKCQSRKVARRHEKSLKNFILSKKFAEIRESRKSELLRIVSSFLRGAFTEEESKRKFETVLLNGADHTAPIYDAVKALGIKDLPYDASVKFIEDFRQWKNNENIKGEWFDYLKIDRAFFRAAGSESVLKISAVDILQLVDCLLIPISYYEQVPPDIPCPGLRDIHTYHNQSIYGIQFDCIDDGGLLSDCDPVGKTFNITRTDGVKANIHVTEFRPEGTPYKHRNHEMLERHDHYLGIAAIDDYFFQNTAPPRENISLYVSDRERKAFDIIMTAYHAGSEIIYSTDFPRWKKYNDWRCKWRKLVEREIDELWNQIVESEAGKNAEHPV